MDAERLAAKAKDLERKVAYYRDTLHDLWDQDAITLERYNEIVDNTPLDSEQGKLR